MVWHNAGSQRDKLAPYRIRDRAAPVDDTENVRSQADGHWCKSHAFLDVADEVFLRQCFSKRLL